MSEQGKIRVLVVDDTRTIRAQITSILKRQQYEVFEAANGKEAVAQACSVKPDIILMDVMMPDISGIECVKQIKAEPTFEDVRIIMVTGASGFDRISEAYRAGCNDYVTKPVDQDKLVKKIEKAARFLTMIRRTKSSLSADTIAKLL